MMDNKRVVIGLGVLLAIVVLAAIAYKLAPLLAVTWTLRHWL